MNRKFASALRSEIVICDRLLKRAASYDDKKLVASIKQLRDQVATMIETFKL